MPRSSKHKSSKHGSRDAGDYSDSEKEASLKERKGKEESIARVSKESGSGDKRKLDPRTNKENYDSVNGEYFEDYTSSKRRKEKYDYGVNDRWNGGEDDKGESSKKSKASSDKSRRRDEGEGEEMKKSSSKGEGNHRESSRRESREFDRDRDRDRERKHREGKNERFIDGDDHHGSKMVPDKTDLNAEDQLQSPELENHLEKRARRKRDDYGHVDKHQDSIEDFSFRHLSSGDDGSRDGRKKEDEKYKDKYREDVDRYSKHQGYQLKDDRSAREHANARSGGKLPRDENDASESRRKKTKSQEQDHDDGQDRRQEHGQETGSEHDRDRDCSRDYDRNRDRNRDRPRRDYERDRYRERDLDRDRIRDRDWDLDRDRNRDQDKDRSRDNYYYNRDKSLSDRERDYDRDASHFDDRSARYKDSRERKKSPDDHDDPSDTKSRATPAPHPERETKSNRGEPDGNRIRSQSRQVTDLHGGQDEFRHMSEQRPKAISSREVTDFFGGSDRSSKYEFSEKSTKLDDGPFSELPVERSSSTKDSPMRLVQRSPTSTTEYRQKNRNIKRQSLENEEMGQRNNARELSASGDRLSRDLHPEKPLADESSQGEFSPYNKASQNNSFFLPRPNLKVGVGSPLVGSLEEDNKVNVSSRYRKVSEPHVGRGQGNAWRGTPNWPSPAPSGFIPFQHGSPHGGFQSMMPQFPSPSLFGIRPSMEMSHSGIPYHMPDVERFSGHFRPPLGWQNMLDVSSSSHMHGWDASNGAFRDEAHMYGGPEWDPRRNRMHGRGWEGGSDTWKTQNSDANMDVSSMCQKDDDDVSAGQATPHSLNNQAKSVEGQLNITSPAKELSKPSSKVMSEKASYYPIPPADDGVDRYYNYYLSKLDISVELAGPKLHSECIGLLIKEQTATVDEEAAVLINLKDGGKVVPKSSSSLLTPPFFPPTNNSVFQRAMDLYKKQRVELNGLPTVEDEKLELLPSPNPDEANDQDMEKGEASASVSVSDAKVSVASISAPLPQKPETTVIADAEKKADEHVSALGSDNSNVSLGVASQVQKPSLIGNQSTSSTSENLVTEETGSNPVPSSDGRLEAVEPVVTDGDNTSRGKDRPENHNNVHRAEGAEACDGGGGGAAADGPLGIKDAAPKVSGPLSHDDESESVLSRIHHSPQNTH